MNDEAIIYGRREGGILESERAELSERGRSIGEVGRAKDQKPYDKARKQEKSSNNSEKKKQGE